VGRLEECSYIFFFFLLQPRYTAVPVNMWGSLPELDTPLCGHVTAQISVLF
jgi:hypothetical protein